MTRYAFWRALRPACDWACGMVCMLLHVIRPGMDRIKKDSTKELT